MKSHLSLEEIEQAISSAKPEKQKRLLIDLPHLLKLSGADLTLLKAAESVFDFWNNPDDIIYDRL